MNRYLRLTQKIALEDILTQKISYIDAYKAQVMEWIINPCRELSSHKVANTDYGMAMWVLLLTFFESHGQYLTGHNSDGKSKAIFVIGFDSFKNFVIQNNLVGNDVEKLESKKLYKFARSGLFHSSVMSKDFLIDCIDFSKYSISQNPINGGWLINPWLLTENLSKYLDFYSKQVMTSQEKKDKFEKVFERLVLGPMKKMANI